MLGSKGIQWLTVRPSYRAGTDTKEKKNSPSKLPLWIAHSKIASYVALDGSNTNTPELKQSGQPMSGTAENSSLSKSSSQFWIIRVSASKKTHFLYCVKFQQWIFVKVIPSSGLVKSAKLVASSLSSKSTISRWSHTLASLSL